MSELKGRVSGAGQGDGVPGTGRGALLKLSQGMGIILRGIEQLCDAQLKIGVSGKLRNERDQF